MHTSKIPCQRNQELLLTAANKWFHMVAVRWRVTSSVALDFHTSAASQAGIAICLAIVTADWIV